MNDVPHPFHSPSLENIKHSTIIQVGEHVVSDRCHLNVTTIIKNMSTQESISLTVLRADSSGQQLSVRPVKHYPLLLNDMVSPTKDFKTFGQRLFRYLKAKNSENFEQNENSVSTKGSRGLEL